MISKRFFESEVFVCEDTANCAISNPTKDNWPAMESYIEQGNYIPKYVFALSSNEFGIELSKRLYINLITKDAQMILMNFK